MSLPVPCLMLVTDRHRGRLPLPEAMQSAVEAGVDAVQVREKDLADSELYRLVCELRQVTRAGCRLIVNGRLDIALAAGADGVHLPEQGLPVEAARRLAPAGFLVGRSVHSVDGARTAEQEGATYVQLGTIFATPSHPELAPAGLHLVREATRGLGIPCLAVGGIDAGNAAGVMAAGASGVAVISAILQAGEIGAAVRSLREALRQPKE